jgi:hypothetical protein
MWETSAGTPTSFKCLKNDGPRAGGTQSPGCVSRRRWPNPQSPGRRCTWRCGTQNLRAIAQGPVTPEVVWMLWMPPDCRLELAAVPRTSTFVAASGGAVAVGAVHAPERSWRKSGLAVLAVTASLGRPGVLLDNTGSGGAAGRHDQPRCRPRDAVGARGRGHVSWRPIRGATARAPPVHAGRAPTKVRRGVGVLRRYAVPQPVGACRPKVIYVRLSRYSGTKTACTSTSTGRQARALKRQCPSWCSCMGAA